MSRQGLRVLGPTQQEKTWDARVTDPRARVPTGYADLDRLLYRGGFAPGELVIIGGRTGTRKTTLTMNLIANMLKTGTSVGFVGLDEPPASYVAKLASAMFARNHEWLEDNWSEAEVRQLRLQYRERAKSFVLSAGYRPTMQDLTKWKEAAELGRDHPMQVVFIDYASLLARDKYAGADVQRIPRLIEDLQVWSNEQEVAVVALHQVGRLDEGTGGRYHGDTPMSLEGLKYGGEEIADVVLATYRPAKSRIGKMSYDAAMADFPQSWDHDKKEEVYQEAVERVAKYKRSTFVQLLKNRPGTRLHEEGIRLLSPNESQQMVPHHDPDGHDESVPGVLGADMKYGAAV